MENAIFQLIAFDLTQLNSDVIRAFSRTYDMDTNPSLSEIINGCISEIGDTSHILFRDTMDHDIRAIGDQPIKVSENWFIWHINDEDFTKVGKLKGKNRKAEIGLVVSPYDIVDRIKEGKYQFVYPDFE